MLVEKLKRKEGNKPFRSLMDEFSKRTAQAIKAHQSQENSNRWNVQYQRTKERAIHCLQEIGETELSDKIKNCSSGNRCGSRWCRSCRYDLVAGLQSRFLDRYKNFNGGEKEFRESVKFVTISHGVFPLSDTDRLDKEISKFRYELRKVFRRTENKENWLVGVIELEIVNSDHWNKLDDSRIKKTQIIEGIVKSNTQQEIEQNRHYVYLHAHALCNIEYGEWYQKNILLNQLKKSFNQTVHSVYVKSLHKDKSIVENLKKLGSYCYKNEYRYKYSFEGSDDNGDYVEDEILGEFVKVWHAVKKRGSQGVMVNIN